MYARVSCRQSARNDRQSEAHRPRDVLHSAYVSGCLRSPRETVIGSMRKTLFYRGNDGWFWELLIDARVVVFGWCETLERAEINARMA